MIRELLSNTTVLRFAQPVVIENFTPVEKAQAWAFAQQCYQDAFEDGNFTKDEIENYIADLGYWSDERELKHNEDVEVLQSMKVDYFEQFIFPSKRTKIKRSIDRQLDVINTNFIAKTYLSEYSCENLRDEAYHLYLFKDSDNPFSFYRKYVVSRLSEETLRSMYFDQIWRMVWNVSKDPVAIFGLNVNCLNDNQLGLLYWSKLYDSIGESSDGPSQAVMNDPIAVDGWLVKQSKKRAAEEKQSLIPDKDGEVFMIVKDKKESEEILSLNTPDAKRVIKSRAKDLKEKGNLDEFNFSHVKQDLAMQVNELNTRRR
jgi:hypothetical protein